MRIIILILLVISGLTAVACSSEATSTPDQQTESRPTADVPATVEAGVSGTREAETAIDATVEAKVAAALTITSSTTGVTNTPAAATLSLDEYLTLCATTDIDLADDATYGDLSSELAAEADRFEALTPPAQLSEWHLLDIENYRTIQAVLDTQPKDDVIDFANLLIIGGAAVELEEKLGEVAARLPEDVLQQMIEASCVDPNLVPYDQADSSDEDAVGVASDRAALVALHNSTEGNTWRNSTNWLTSSPLNEWHGVTTRSDGRVIALNLESNSLVGTLPAALGDLTNLESLQLYNNSIIGRIPAQLGDLTNLRELNLGSDGYSRLTGPIPTALGNLTNLESLTLNNNELSGPIPATLGNLYNLRELNLWSNNLTGPVPAWLYDLPNLQYLSLGWNELTGPVPAWLGDLSNLVGLVLTVNELTGPIPAELGDLSNLKRLDLSFNNLTGPIPASLGDLSNLEGLSLRANHQLTGCIPIALRDVAENDLNRLDLPYCR